MKVLNDATTNWTIVPCPTPAWASLVYPRLEPPAALERLWSEIAHVTAGSTSPIRWRRGRAGWPSSRASATALNDLGLDRVRFEGPGTDLTIGLLPSSTWLAAKFETVDGIEHQPNIPTEEVFTTPDPERVDGEVDLDQAAVHLRDDGHRAARSASRAGARSQVDAEQGAEVIRGMIAADEGAARLGEVALVDREGRIGPLGTVFFDTLLDENAASHIALGQGYVAVRGRRRPTTRASTRASSTSTS